MIVRDAVPSDAAAIAALTIELGFPCSADDVAGRLAPLLGGNTPPLVADADGPVGCLTWHVMAVLHRPTSVGRISMLVVTARARGGGIGRALVEAAETRCREHGCGLIEVTSNMQLAGAHIFYERLGYERTSFRFARTL